MDILRRRIKDEYLISLIWKFLKAGYLEDWKFNPTYSGTPQGSVISPILANIYLNEFDTYVEEYIEKFNRGKRRERNSEYRFYSDGASKLRVKYRGLWEIMTADEKEKAKCEVNELMKKAKQIPAMNPMDSNYRRLLYCRYADDFICGVIGSKEDAETIKADFSRYLKEKLGLDMSEEKTLITHSNEKAAFLGYEIAVSRSNEYKKISNGQKARTFNGRVHLFMPHNKWVKKLTSCGAMEIKQQDGKEIWKPQARKDLINKEPIEILSIYNAEIRGLYNYYCLASNVCKLQKYYYIMEYSMYKTFAGKYKCRTRKVNKKYRKNGRFIVTHMTKTGVKERYFYDGGFKRKKPTYKSECDIMPRTIYTAGRTSLVERLKARECELCGATDDLVMHHVRKLKNLQGKESWERHMIARKRKTIAVCRSCHKKIHDGKID